MDVMYYNMTEIKDTPFSKYETKFKIKEYSIMSMIQLF